MSRSSASSERMFSNSHLWFSNSHFRFIILPSTVRKSRQKALALRKYHIRESDLAQLHDTYPSLSALKPSPSPRSCLWKRLQSSYATAKLSHEAITGIVAGCVAVIILIILIGLLLWTHSSGLARVQAYPTSSNSCSSRPHDGHGLSVGGRYAAPRVREVRPDPVGGEVRTFNNDLDPQVC